MSKLAEQLQVMEKKYANFKQEFAKDGTISKDEATVLKSVNAKLEKLRAAVAAHSPGGGAAANPLAQEYAKLGGDAELQTALVDEDKAARASIEVTRAMAMTWQKKRVEHLDERKQLHTRVLKRETTLQAPLKTWLDRERPLAETIAADVKALGPKLQTEPGKKLAHRLVLHNDMIRKVDIAAVHNTKVFEKTRLVMGVLENRYKDVDRIYEGFEKVVRDKRIELDNELQMSAMSLKDKVAFLKGNPQATRTRIQKELQESFDQLKKASVDSTMGEEAEFAPPEEFKQGPAFDWDGFQKELDVLEAASLEDLKKNDPKLDGIRKKYEAGGGDKALFKKRLEAWKKEVADWEGQEKKRAENYQKLAADLQEQAAKSSRNLVRGKEEVEAIQTRMAKITSRLEPLKAMLESDSGAGPSSREKAEIKVLVRELKRLKPDLNNRQDLVKAFEEAKKNAAALIEQERQRHEVLADDDPRSGKLVKPTSEDIHAMPLEEKQAELTAK